MLCIKPLRLPGGYRIACATAPEREKPRTGFVALANAVPALPASVLSRLGRVLPAACAVGHPNPRLAKIHRNYTVEEVASVFGVHRNTVREWVKRGLPTSDDRRPMLILGADLVVFLRARRVKNKRTCRPGEMYCVRCRAPRAPAGDMADYQPVTATLGNLIGICSTCEAMMYRRVSLARLGEVRGKLDITLPQALPHIDESAEPSVNSDLG